MIAIDLRKQKTLYADPKAVPQINFTRNLARTYNNVFERNCCKFFKRNRESILIIVVRLSYYVFHSLLLL